MEQSMGIDTAKEELSVFHGTDEGTFQNRQGLSTFLAYLRKAFPDLCKVVLISTFTKVVDPKDVLVPEIDHVREELSLYLSSYDLVIKTWTAVGNRIEALRHHPHTPRGLLLLLRHDLAPAEKTEAHLLARMEELIKADGGLSLNCENLLTIPGVGKIWAITLVTFFRPCSETKRSEITALVSPDPARKESGTSLALSCPTLSAINHNSRIRTSYEPRAVNHKPISPPFHYTLCALRKVCNGEDSRSITFEYCGDTENAPGVTGHLVTLIDAISHDPHNLGA